MKLSQVKHTFSLESEVKAFVDEVTTPTLTEFAVMIFDLMRIGHSNMNDKVVAFCLQILINLTFDSPNTSISLMSCPSFR